MIEEGGTAVPDGVHGQQLGGETDAFRIERTVKLIPQVIEDFREILGGPSGNRHAAGERPVKMRMGADLSRHDDFFFGVDFFFGRVLREQFGGRPDFADRFSVDPKRIVGNHPVFCFPGHEGCVVD